MTQTSARQVQTSPGNTLIHVIRDKRVILDSDLAQIYRVSTKRFNEAVKRNRRRFPGDFVFRLSTKEYADLRSQIATSRLHGGRRYRPIVFTEHGAVMAASILNSRRAVQMSIFVVREFIKMRAVFAEDKNLREKLQDLERKLTARLDKHERAIAYVLEEIKKLMENPPLPEPKRRPIGFRSQE